MKSLALLKGIKKVTARGRGGIQIPARISIQKCPATSDVVTELSTLTLPVVRFKNRFKSGQFQ